MLSIPQETRCETLVELTGGQTLGGAALRMHCSSLGPGRKAGGRQSTHRFCRRPKQPDGTGQTAMRGEILRACTLLKKYRYRAFPTLSLNLYNTLSPSKTIKREMVKNESLRSQSQAQPRIVTPLMKMERLKMNLRTICRLSNLGSATC